MKTFGLIAVLLQAVRVTGATNNVASPTTAPTTGYEGPFLWNNTQAPSVRFQQVYSGSDFQLLGAGPGRITQIIFLTGGAPLDVQLANVQIDLSTTARAPDALSSTFNQNIGQDEVVVFSGPLHLVGLGEIPISLSRPFDYDWHSGNLLLDVRNFQTIAPQPLFLFNASGTLGDGSSLAIAFDVNSPNGQVATGALSTVFAVTEVPEPRAPTLGLIALTSFAGICWLRRRRRIAGDELDSFRLGDGLSSKACEPRGACRVRPLAGAFDPSH